MQLLPDFDELLPITNEKHTFYECGFNVPFNELSFQKKLQVTCDLVRQTILPSPIVNPSNDTHYLIGNCHTACRVYINYLKKLNIGQNYRYCFARQKFYEPDDNTTIHAVVLVDDENFNTYQVDPSPFVGFGIGQVINITYNKMYQEYYEINDEIKYYIDIFNEIIYLDYISKLDKNNLKFYMNIIKETKSYTILNDYISRVLKILSKYVDEVYEKDRMISNALKLKPYDKENIENIKRLNRFRLNAINLWQEELNDLKKSNKDYYRQLMLAQYIIHEKKIFDENEERYINIFGKKERLSFINSRYMYENNLNMVMIKPSAYYIGKENYIKNKISNNNIVLEYDIDLSLKTKQMGLKPMVYSHTVGEEYIRSMMGNSKILIIKDNADNLRKIKKELRTELGENMYYKYYDWVDGNKILWHPYVTNFVHSTDGPAEAALHFMIGYPEHQQVTRYMYPNLKLVREK